MTFLRLTLANWLIIAQMLVNSKFSLGSSQNGRDSNTQLERAINAGGKASGKKINRKSTLGDLMEPVAHVCPQITSHVRSG